ncbi:MAG TPA: glycosyltransferase family 4 protein [Dongiaceae bacterium]|nr:glycosyltransferase family 4 protein [Dongiaceae bacterium]
MKLRLAWVADAEDADTYSAKEARVLLRALARRGNVVTLWFAVGSTEPPHFWHGIRVFPIPPESLGRADFLKTLMAQQRPHAIVSNVAPGGFNAGVGYLAQNGAAWIHRPQPAEAGSSTTTEETPAQAGAGFNSPALGGGDLPPFLAGLDPAIRDGEEPTAVLNHFERLVAERTPATVLTAAPRATHLVMRQQLFCNSSLAQVMFELTNALIELGFPAVAQDEHPEFSKPYIHREEEVLRAAAVEKYERIARSLSREYDPENAITVHFSMFKSGVKCARHGTFPSLGPREVLYTTGNHTMTARGVRELAGCFEKILAPSHHVLRPYLEAGLDRTRGAVIPHGVDPLNFSPASPPLRYETDKGFKFLQTSFPWITEKGFDLTLKAFCRAFSESDDVALVLRTPRIRDSRERESTFGRLDALVREARARNGAPEVLLVEQDVELSRRGGVYTGADCYLFPLRAEGFGMTILEAMACGLPVIATPWSGPADFLSPRYAYTLRHSNPIPERARDGTVLRFHVEPDLDHLIYLMRHVYGHRDEAKAMGRMAAGVARGEWTWKHAAEKLAAFFGLEAESAESVV